MKSWWENNSLKVILFVIYEVLSGWYLINLNNLNKALKGRTYFDIAINSSAPLYLLEAIIVARPEQKNVVVISEKEYNSWQETNYLLKSKANQEALAHSINQLDDSTKHHFLTPEEFERMAAANDQA